MTLDAAPYFDAVAFGPESGAAFWAACDDGIRVRVGAWPLDGARGTVLIFPGRTEFVEKYGDCAARLAALGFAAMAVDWRGQGLADRLLPDRRVGHVTRFTDYQRDVQCLLEVARALNMPRPYHLLAHSMGGAIGLRAAMEGLDVASCAFTGPMWGIRLSRMMRPAAWLMSGASGLVGRGHLLPPSTTYESYVAVAPFEGNMLTSDPEIFDRMKRQIAEHPETALGGPSLTWLGGALRECRALSRRPSPRKPALCIVGALEQIVDIPAMQTRMADWPGGSLHLVPDARHEVLMERAEIRDDVYDRLDALFSGAEDTRARSA